MCIRNDKGEFVIAKSDCVPFCLPVREGEAMDLFKTIQWVQNLELSSQQVVFELDCQVMVNRVKSKIEDAS